ncbi:hypothetical protein SAMN04515671_2173 [Nakamurella panacisegetis]|uniref:Uncharacterized protein n=1 Tax=Nakamurella panacisegetis TaxID=1090615 RepID=A0A1H0N2I5_9ACTN|nr:hypothetical protein [Nakamurella panacisegetis]SDO86842.1 hypothetical protein SAMN04515671_2173 [Nakamurella panacisegetis]
MLDFIFEAGFDAVVIGRAGERSRARRSEKTLEQFESTGTATFPGARRVGANVESGYLTVKDGLVVFSRVSGSEMTHVEVDLLGLQSFWPMANEGRAERSVNRYWTLFRLDYRPIPAVEAAGQGDSRVAAPRDGDAAWEGAGPEREGGDGGREQRGAAREEVVLACAPNGHASVLKVFADAGIPQIQPERWGSATPKRADGRRRR